MTCANRSGRLNEACASYMSALLIITGFQLEFIMHSLFCCQRSNCRGGTWMERIRNTESNNGFLTLVNKRKAAAG